MNIQSLTVNFVAYRWFLWTSLPFLLIQTIISFIWHSPLVTLPFHDTYFIFTKSQILTLIAAFFIFIATIYYVMLKMDRHLHQDLCLIHYFSTIISILIFIFGMVISGFFIRSESTDVKETLFDFKTFNKYIAGSGFLLLFGQIVFIINCLYSFIRKEKKYH
jgi:heme/copper-type cytochrome/quinol oxidase subunit 1